MSDMDLVHIDTINVWSLEEGDMIQIHGEVVTVTNLESVEDGYIVSYSNDFGEPDVISVDDDTHFKLFMID